MWKLNINIYAHSKRKIEAWNESSNFSHAETCELEEMSNFNHFGKKIFTDWKPNSGQYLQAEVDGGFGRDVLEFLVKGDVVSYRCVAKKVTYVYPFTTALGDSKGQEERMKIILDKLGWYAPSFDSMD